MEGYLWITRNTSRSNFPHARYVVQALHRGPMQSLYYGCVPGLRVGPLPPEKLSNWRRLCLKRGCTPVHYRAVSDAKNRSLAPITSGGGSAMPSMVPLMLLLGSSKLSGVSQEGGREHAHVPNPNRFLRALTKCNPFPHLNSREQELRCGHSIARVGRYRWVLGFPRNG